MQFSPVIPAIFILAAFQANASYRGDETCLAGESCIITSFASGHQSILKLLPVEDDESGAITETRLNNASSITDTFFDSHQSCYRGRIADICHIGEMLSGNTNLDYMQGGHFQALDFNCYAINKLVRFDYIERSDYSSRDQEVTIRLAPCQ